MRSASINSDIQPAHHPHAMGGSGSRSRRPSGDEVARLLFASQQQHDSLQASAVIEAEWQEGRLSAVRRTFCTITAFDFIMVFFLWVVYAQVTIYDGQIKDMFIVEVEHYKIQDSLFDIVLLAAWRTTLLLLTYGLFRSDSVWMVALTTAGTCGFLLAKSFVFSFKKDDNTNQKAIFEFLVLVSGFVLAWAETWFLDFKMLPRERKLRTQAYFANHEKQPFVRDGLARFYGTTAGQSSFYSAFGSEDGDVEKDAELGHGGIPSPRGPLSSQEREFIQSGVEVLTKTLDVLLAPRNSWILEKQNNFGDAVFTKNVKDIGKLWKLEVLLEHTPSELFEELHYNGDKQPEWNSTVVENRILERLDAHTHLQYSVAAEAGGGLVSCRDFVNVVRWQMTEGQYISAAKSITCDNMPPHPKYIRAENRLSVWVITPLQDQPFRSLFSWLQNTNFKGWLPQSVIDQALGGAMLDFAPLLRQRMAKVCQ